MPPAELALGAATLARAAPRVPGMSVAARNAIHYNYFRCRDELQSIRDRLAAARAAVVVPVGAVQHGFEVDNTKAVMAFGQAGVQANDTGLAFKFGTTATANFRPAGLALDGATIQLG